MDGLRGGDSINPAALPPGLNVYFGYGDGRWPDYQAIAAGHPTAKVYRFAVTAADRGDFLDIENGDATIAQAPGWVRAELAAGSARPGLYIRVSALDALVDELAHSGIDRSVVRLGAAHYDVSIGAHICAPGCYPALRNRADGTQWVDHGTWDEWLLSPTFIEDPIIAEEDLMADLQIIERGTQEHIYVAYPDKTVLHWWRDNAIAEGQPGYGYQGPETLPAPPG